MIRQEQLRPLLAAVVFPDRAIYIYIFFFYVCFYSAYLPRGGAWKCTDPRMVPVLKFFGANTPL